MSPTRKDAGDHPPAKESSDSQCSFIAPLRCRVHIVKKEDVKSVEMRKSPLPDAQEVNLLDYAAEEYKGCRLYFDPKGVFSIADADKAEPFISETYKELFRTLNDIASQVGFSLVRNGVRSNNRMVVHCSRFRKSTAAREEERQKERNREDERIAQEMVGAAAVKDQNRKRILLSTYDPNGNGLENGEGKKRRRRRKNIKGVSAGGATCKFRLIVMSDFIGFYMAGGLGNPAHNGHSRTTTDVESDKESVDPFGDMEDIDDLSVGLPDGPREDGVYCVYKPLIQEIASVLDYSPDPEFHKQLQELLQRKAIEVKARAIARGQRLPKNSNLSLPLYR